MITVFIISNSVEERVDVCLTTPPSKVLEIENLIFFCRVEKYTYFLLILTVFFMIFSFFFRLEMSFVRAIFPLDVWPFIN